MQNIYKITYDIKVGGDWLGGLQPNGFDSRNVLANGDARAACVKLERYALKQVYSDYDETGTELTKKLKVEQVRIVSVVQIATDVLVK